MKKLLILLLAFTFATELEVDGDLKVTGSVDASGNPIKNVGPPQALTDAINGNALQDALRDDTNYEYKIRFVHLDYSSPTAFAGYFWVLENYTGQATDISAFNGEIQSLLNDGWILHSISGDDVSWWIFKRPLEDEE